MKQFLAGLVAATVATVTLQAVPATATSAASVRPAHGVTSVAAAGSVSSGVSVAAGKSGKAGKGTSGKAGKGKKKPQQPKGFRVKRGAVFNDPYGSAYAWRGKVMRAIRHARPGSIMKIMSWSFYDSTITDALIDAYRRGVTIRMFMSRGLSSDPATGSNFRRLKNVFAQRGPKSKRPVSWGRTCSNSCRGKGGSMHFKWWSFSQTGRSKNVVMQGSANLNIRASIDQWNDLYTWVDDEEVYELFDKVFRQSQKDKKQAPITLRRDFARIWIAPRAQDPVLDLLDEVRCSGAGSLGTNGKTKIRVAAAVISSTRGEAIASRLRKLANQGCDIKVIYTLAPRAVRGIFGGMATRQLAFDRNDDGLYDDYLHMKAMAVLGRVGDKRNTGYVLNGSGNWSTTGKISDEQGMVVNRVPIARQYSRWIDTLYGRAVAPETAARTAMRTTADGEAIDPYANIRSELR